MAVVVVGSSIIFDETSNAIKPYAPTVFFLFLVPLFLLLLLVAAIAPAAITNIIVKAKK